MRRILRSIPIFLAGAIMFVPFVTFAQESLFGPIIPKFGACRCELVLVEGTNQVSQSAPNFGCVLQTVQATINIGLAVGIVIFVFVIAYAGFLLLTNATNPGGISKAKNLIKNAFVGLAIAFLAWLGVDFVMKAIYNPSATIRGQNLGPWNSIWVSNNMDLCLTVRNPVPITQGSLTLRTIISGGSGTEGDPSTLEAAVCRAPQNQRNSCSVTNMRNSCFRERAEDASRVCMVESGGGKYWAESGSDMLNRGDGPSYSFGLWQINLTVHTPGGLNCPAAFSNAAGTGPCEGCGKRSITGRSAGLPLGNCTCRLRADSQSQQLYERCKVAAKNPQLATEYVCRVIYRNQRFHGGWETTANKCNVR
jgi:hypothetical protein